ncbi:MAG TPA: hypothetical protein VGP28_06690 [Methylocella sp.]|nr:hypothetical protein [Methylocella sp.]
MTFEQQVLEFATIENAQLALDFLYPLCVTPIGRLRDFVDLHEVARHRRDKLEDGRKPCVVGNEELATNGARVALALVVVVQIDIDAFGLAFDDENRLLTFGLYFWRLPNDDIGAGAFMPMHRAPLLVHLDQAVTVVIDKVANEALPNDFFRLRGHLSPFAAKRYPKPVPFSMQGIGRRWKRCCRTGIWLLRSRRHTYSRLPWVVRKADDGRPTTICPA